MDPNPQPQSSETPNTAPPNTGAWSNGFDAPLETWKAYIRILQKLKEYNPPEYAKVPEILKRYGTNEIDALTPYDIQSLQAANALPPGNPRLASEEELKTIRNYIKTLHRLKGTSEYAKVPPVLRNMSDDEIANLTKEYLEAFRLMNVLPGSMLPGETGQDPDDRRFDQAITEYCNQDPELRELIHDPKLFHDQTKMQEFMAHPKIHLFFSMHPDLKALLDRNIQKILIQTRQAMGWPAPQTPEEPSGPYRSHPYGTPDPSQVPQFPLPVGNPVQQARQQREIAKTAAQIGQMYSEGSAALMESMFESNKKLGEAFRKAGG